MSNTGNNENKKDRAQSAIERKIAFKMGIWCVIFLFYMMFGFGTVCVQGYVYYDNWKWILLLLGVGIFVVGSGLLSLQNLDKSFTRKLKFSIVDILFLATIVTWLIGSLLSVDRSSAFLGDAYRKTGFLYVGAIIIAAFIVSKYAFHHFALSIGFAVWTIITNIVGIMQYYEKDIFNWQMYRQYTSLRSMFGNVDQYSAMCAFFLAVLIAIFMLEKNLPALIVTGIAIVVDTIAGLASSSAGFYFALFGVLVAIGFALRNGTYLRRLWMAAIFMYAGVLIQRQFYAKPEYFQSFNEQITLWIFGNGKLIIGAGIALAVLGVLVFLLKNVIDKAGVWISRVWFILCGLMLIGFIALVIYANKNQANISEEAMLYKLVITDGWGSGRGRIWKEILRVYKEGSIKDKLFGIGFDNLSRLNLLPGELGPATLADAHCAYLDMLLTCGFLGAGLYFALIIAIIVKCARSVKNNPGVIVALVTAAVYLSVVCINFNLNVFLPSCWMAIAFGLSFAKDSDKQETGAMKVNKE